MLGRSAQPAVAWPKRMALVVTGVSFVVHWRWTHGKDSGPSHGLPRGYVLAPSPFTAPHRPYARPVDPSPTPEPEAPRHDDAPSGHLEDVIALRVREFRLAQGISLAELA